MCSIHNASPYGVLKMAEATPRAKSRGVARLDSYKYSILPFRSASLSLPFVPISSSWHLISKVIKLNDARSESQLVQRCDHNLNTNKISII